MVFIAIKNVVEEMNIFLNVIANDLQNYTFDHVRDFVVSFAQLHQAELILFFAFKSSSDEIYYKDNESSD